MNGIEWMASNQRPVDIPLPVSVRRSLKDAEAVSTWDVAGLSVLSLPLRCVSGRKHADTGYGAGAVTYYRSKRLLEAARELPCQLCGVEDGTVVAAHSNQLRDGKGRGIKAPDHCIAALCHKCHYGIDQGRDLDKASRQALWDLGHMKTLREFIERGVLK